MFVYLQQSFFKIKILYLPKMKNFLHLSLLLFFICSNYLVAQNSAEVLDLKLTSMCSYDEDERRWRVRNANDFTVNISWEVYGTNHSGELTIEPGDSFFFTPNVGGANTTKIYWNDENGNQKSTVKASNNELCNPPVEKLKLTSMCSYDNDERRWRVRNPNNFVVQATWEVYGTNHTGALTVEPGDSFFFTPNVGGPNTTKLYWNDENGNPKSTVKASNNELCNPPVEKLKLTSMCSYDNDERRWRVRNPNNFAIQATWLVYGSEHSGALTIEPGDNFFFTPNVGGANTTVLYWKDQNGKQRGTVKASNNQLCEPSLNCTPQGISGGEVAFSGVFNAETNYTITNVSVAAPTSGNAQIEYMWMMSIKDVPNVVGNSDWQPIPESKDMLELDVTFLNLTQTTYFIRCARLVGCDEPYWGETPRVEVKVLDCSPAGIDGGEIAFEGYFNAETNNTITNVSAAAPTSGNAQIEYMWMMSIKDVPNVVGNSDWQPIPESKDMLELDVTFLNLTQTTYFIRCARLVGCEEPYWGETPRVAIKVLDCSPAGIDGGAITFEGTYNPNGGNIIENVTLPTSTLEGQAFEYVWLMNTEDVPNYVGTEDGWMKIENSENQVTLNIDDLNLTETTYFIRCARILGCDRYWGETPSVEVPVDKCLPNGIDGGKITFEGVFNPDDENIIENVELASSPYTGQNYEYIWLKSFVNEPNTEGNNNWMIVEGSEGLTSLSLTELTDTTYFIRCARLEGCEEYWGESNIVEVTYVEAPDPCEGLELSAQISYLPGVGLPGPDTGTQPSNLVLDNVYFTSEPVAIDYEWQVWILDGDNEEWETLMKAENHTGDVPFFAVPPSVDYDVIYRWVAKATACNATYTTVSNEIEVSAGATPPIGINFTNSKTLVYPVPAQNEINLTFENSDYVEADFKIIGLDGNAILNETESLEMGENNVSIPVENLPDGVYLIQVIRGNTIETQRVVIQH